MLAENDPIIRNGGFYAFIPHHLHIENSPELDIFPFNVMFMSFKTENGKRVSGHSLYYPDLASFKINDNNELFLHYINIYGGDFRLVISYDPKTKRYTGFKMRGDEVIFEASGIEWQGFFTLMTMRGLENRKAYQFESIKK